MYTLDNIQDAPSYEALRRNGFTDANVVKYYNMPSSFNRTTYFKQIKDGIIAIVEVDTPPITPHTIDTQMCTESLSVRVDKMIKECLNKNFLVNGNYYNMNALGWTFKYNNNKTRFGVCKTRYRRSHSSNERVLVEKRLEISLWSINNTNGDFAFWLDTMLHEIAHAIDHEINATSDHSYRWVRIAHAIGCNGERCGEAEIDTNVVTKYTISCPNNHDRPSHKYSSKIANGKKSCGKCSNKFNKDYLLTQTQNY